MSLKRLTVALSLLLLFVGCDSKGDTKDGEIKSSNKEVSSKEVIQQQDLTFTIQTVDGETLHIKDMPNGFKFEEIKDKAVLVIFFGYRCPPCIREIPRLNNLISKHSKDLEIIAFEVQGLSEDELREFIKSNDIKYKVVAGLKYMRFISYIQQRAQWKGAIPFLIALNKSGEVEFAQVGGLFEKELEYIYKEITKEKK